MPSAPTRQAVQVALAATIANALCMTAAISATIGVFLVPIAQDFGWPRAGVSGVLGLISVISAISYPLIGRAMDRFARAGCSWRAISGSPLASSWSRAPAVRCSISTGALPW
jgi:MFS family permease